MTDYIFKTVTVKFICNKTGRLHGIAETVEGSTVYIPRRLASRLKVFDVVEGKLKPSSDPRSVWCLVGIVGDEWEWKERVSRNTPGLRLYDSSNTVPRQAPRSNA